MLNTNVTCICCYLVKDVVVLQDFNNHVLNRVGDWRIKI